MNLADRIKAELDQRQWSVTELAKRSGIKQPTLHRIMVGDTKDPKMSNIEKIAKTLNVDPLWLSSGKAPKATEANAVFESAVFTENTEAPSFFEIDLPYFEETELAAGNGQINVIESTESFKRFNTETLAMAGVPENHAACARIKGDSMEPLIPSGTTVAIDKSFTRIVDGEIYAIDHDGMLRIKKLYRLPMNRIRIVSENDIEFPEEIVSPPDIEHIRIIGRVFWWEVVRRVSSF